MALVPKAKELLQRIPYPVGACTARIPYWARPGGGRAYLDHRRRIRQFDGLRVEEKRARILDAMRQIVTDAWQRVPFYRDLYRRSAFEPADLKTFDDIGAIPVVTKDDLKAVELSQRSASARARYETNTGGSSGSTLSFFITPDLIPNEWAHMHSVWERLGYRTACLKLTFGGLAPQGKAVSYDGLRHQYWVSVYRSFTENGAALRDLTLRRRIEFLHGYPSALYEFADYCDRDGTVLRDRLRTTLKGVLLGSEFPIPRFRKRIEEVFRVPTISWYGHSERSILAAEKGEAGLYFPFQTYGYCEALSNPITGGARLVGTSYLNRASPFIRYDTGDDIEPVEVEGGLLKSFRVREGRVGEFVTDRQGSRIPLTALVFGRHHRVFGIARFIQVQQVRLGGVKFLVTLKVGMERPAEMADWFDLGGVDLDVSFKLLDEPIRTASGKVTLKVP